jgi:hypothetical protein
VTFADLCRKVAGGRARLYAHPLQALARGKSGWRIYEGSNKKAGTKQKLETAYLDRAVAVIGLTALGPLRA